MRIREGFLSNVSVLQEELEGHDNMIMIIRWSSSDALARFGKDITRLRVHVVGKSQVIGIAK